MPKRLVVPLLGLALLAPAFADSAPVDPALADFESGMAAYAKSEYQNAYQMFLQAAQQGNMHAQGKLAGLYLYGVGVEKDLIEAYAWFELANRQGDSAAAMFRDAIADQLDHTQIRSAAVRAEDYHDQYLAPFLEPEQQQK